MRKTSQSNKDKTTQTNETHLQGFASLCGTFAIGLFVMTFVFQNFVIPSSSMASTLLVGDHVLVERATLSPPTSWTSFVPYHELHRGEPIVFYKPAEDANGEHTILVKRVIGISGDRIHLRRGIVYLNGVAQNEPQAAKPTYANFDPYRDDFPSIPASGIYGVPPSGPLTSQLTFRAKIWSSLPTITLSWETTAPTASMAATGDLSRAATSSAARFSSTGLSRPRKIRSTRPPSQKKRASPFTNLFTS